MTRKQPLRSVPPKFTLADLEGQYHYLAQAIITQAVEDVHNRIERIDALSFLYGPGIALAQCLGIEPSAMKKRVLELSKIAPSDIAVMKPPEAICAPPLFRWRAPCEICPDHDGPFIKPYHTWLHWKTKHTQELTHYTRHLLEWINTGPGISSADRMEVLSILTRIDMCDLTTWVERARRQNLSG